MGFDMLQRCRGSPRPAHQLRQPRGQWELPQLGLDLQLCGGPPDDQDHRPGLGEIRMPSCRRWVGGKAVTPSLHGNRFDKISYPCKRLVGMAGKPCSRLVSVANARERGLLHGSEDWSGEAGGWPVAWQPREVDHTWLVERYSAKITSAYIPDSNKIFLISLQVRRQDVESRGATLGDQAAAAAAAIMKGRWRETWRETRLGDKVAAAAKAASSLPIRFLLSPCSFVPLRPHFPTYLALGGRI